MDLDPDQMTALRSGSKQVRRAAALLRSVNPESFEAADQAKQICDKAWSSRVDEPSVEEVIRGIAGLVSYCPALGPGTQEVLQNALERLTERLGLSHEVGRAVAAPQETGRSGRSR